ncbi:hypothetical protein C9374_009100 [Naegleria lovaniensis]|uniref:Uncharacterized protein n=1 Tax=Naegleria lovaniensis TaxID=51637 RepID=A0AA88GHH8_NAELO|nr:uncharacterized protein C9374_009100 [Naegleria lovaniensis]KAG2377584.1 hypothetical protein C9374_009100 [Naegleria lovaniensis]
MLQPQTPISNFDHYHSSINSGIDRSVPFSPMSPFDSRKNPLCRELGKLFQYEFLITPENLFPVFLGKANDLVRLLCYQDFGNSFTKQQAASTLLKYQRDDFQSVDEDIFEAEIIPSLCELLNIQAFDAFQNVNTTTENNNCTLDMSNTSNNNNYLPESIQQYVSSEPNDIQFSSYAISEQDQAILSPPRHERGSTIVPFDLNDIDMLTRIFHHIIRTSRKLFWILNIRTQSEKSSKFQDLDFTNLSITMKRHPVLRNEASHYLKKLKAIRNEWAHFIHKNSQVPSDQMNKAFIYSLRIYNEYLAVSKTAQSMKAIEYAEKRSHSMSELQLTYKHLKQKRNWTSSIVNMFYRNAEQGDLEANANSTLLQVLKQVIQKLEQDPNSSEARLYQNAFLLDFIPQSPQLFSCLKELREQDLTQQQIMYYELNNKYQLLLQETQAATKSINPYYLIDQRFIDTKTFFASVVVELQQTKDPRHRTFLNAFCLYLVKKALKKLREEHVQVSDSAIQEFLQKRAILNDENTFSQVLEGEIKKQSQRFRMFWLVLANGMYHCCNNSLHIAILNFAWCQSCLEDPTFLNYPNMKTPFEYTVRIFIERCTYWLSEEIYRTSFTHLNINAVKHLIHYCLVCCRKFSNFDMSQSYSMVADTLSRALNNQEIVNQLNEEDVLLVHSLYYQKSALDMSHMLKPDINVFLDQDKQSRISIADEARMRYQEAFDRLFAH